MKHLSIRETRAQLGKLDELLEAEGEIIITRRGQPIARVVTATEEPSVPSHRELRESLPRMSVTSAEILREERDAR